MICFHHSFLNLIVYIIIQIIYVFNNEQDAIQDPFLSGGLNSEVSSSYTGCYTNVKEPSLPNYLPITRGRIVEYY